jgi:spore germination cell wall hydrolase CwlJ-like protein
MGIVNTGMKDSLISQLARINESRPKAPDLAVSYREFMESETLDEGWKQAGLALMFAGLAAVSTGAMMSANSVKAVEQPESDVMPDFGTEENAAYARDYPAVKTLVKQGKAINGLSANTRREWAYLTMTIWGEARGNGKSGMMDVASVIRNRLALGRWGHTYREVVTSDKQFSCWNPKDENMPKMLNMLDIDTAILQAHGTPQYQELIAQYGNDEDFKMWIVAKNIAWQILINRLQDTTAGADHYHTGDVDKIWNKAMTITKQEGNHIFFRDRPRASGR